jgi:hypothetical protein
MKTRERVYVVEISNSDNKYVKRIKYDEPLSPLQISNIESIFSARFLPPMEDCGIYHIYMFKKKDGPENDSEV